VLLNLFFARMADAIFLHDGTLDKFIGDSVLAVFGAPLDLPNHALNAVRAAQTMHRALAALNDERPEPVLQMRIAIHTGVAMVGDMGSPKRREYTVLGDVVNTAARIEDSAAGAGQTVITRATFDRLENKVPARSPVPRADQAGGAVRSAYRPLALDRRGGSEIRWPSCAHSIDSRSARAIMSAPMCVRISRAVPNRWR
jgi:adenylate cyclase